MASASATYHWGDSGDMVSFELTIENDYPDALATARATIVAAIRELTGMTEALDVDIDPDVI